MKKYSLLTLCKSRKNLVIFKEQEWQICKDEIRESLAFMHSRDMTYCLVSNRDQVYTVNLNEIPKTEVIPSKVSHQLQRANVFTLPLSFSNAPAKSASF